MNEVATPVKSSANEKFSVKDKVLFLRLYRLGRLPPATYCAEILQEEGFPLLALEYGNIVEEQMTSDERIPRLRLASPFAKWLPKPLRSSAILVTTFFRLCNLFSREGRPQIIFAQGLQEYTLAYFINRVFGTPYVCHVHEIFEREDVSGVNKLLFRLEGVAFRSARFLIFPDQSRAVIYQMRYRITVPIYLSFNSARLRRELSPRNLKKELGIPQDHIVMAYIGGIAEENPIELGISALAKIPNLHFLVWGWGEKHYLKSLTDLAKREGVEDRVKFLGVIDDKKWDVLAGCEIGFCLYRPMNLRMQFNALPSNKFMEALATGQAVLTSNQPDFVETVQRYGVGVSAKAFTKEAVVEALQLLTESPRLLESKRKNARALHLEQFHYEKQIKGVVEDLKVILGRPAPVAI